MIKTIEQITAEIDSLMLDLLGPLRASKTINQAAFTKLKEKMDNLLPLMETQQQVPKELVGKLWFIFTSMLSEAEHAKTNREEIEILAWDIQERLRCLFGPKF
ncbi:MAG: hypothetical protein GXO69_02115 [Acidobacteria bacterium]|nr:hypothetical protein [Acidobacteriota bacterium]